MLMQLSGISKSFAAETVLRNVHIQVQERDRIGLIGVNGAGKSTLLKIMAGLVEPDEGIRYVAKETSIGYLSQHSDWKPTQTIRDTLLEVYRPLLDMERELRDLERRIAEAPETRDDAASRALLEKYASLSEQFEQSGGYAVEANVRGMLHGMGFGDFPPDTPASHLSGGQKTRLALARLLLQSPDLLLLDEPTNYLDIPTMTWLESFLKNYPGAVVVVSHDRFFLDAVVQDIVEVERTEAKRYPGNYTKFLELKAAQLEIERKRYEQQQETIARMEEFIRRNLARASTTKRAQSRQKALERMERLEKPQGEQKRVRLSFTIDRWSGRDVLKVAGLSKAWPEKGTLFNQVSFQLRRGENSALIGPNGIGKTTLLKILVGEESADSGQVEWGANVKIGYFDQEHRSLNPNNTVLDEVWNAYPHLEEVTIRTALGHFLFSGEDVLKKVSSLSGGEKARVSLAKLMLLNANVLILDEPTNHLDVYSKEALESALAEYEGTILFISHDRYFLNRMADNILELGPDGVRHFPGNYDDYVEKKKEWERLAAAEQEQEAGRKPGQSSASPRPAGKGVSAGVSAEEPAKGAEAYEREKQARREERMRQRRAEQLEREIGELEQKIAQEEQTLTLPEVFSDHERLRALTEELDQMKRKLQTLYEEWEACMSD